MFPVSQEQRNTVRARFRCEVTSRAWLALGGTYDSGLPIDFGGTEADAAALGYTQNILNRVNFSDLRPRPLWSLNASAGIMLRKSERYPVRFKIDGTNLTDSLNVINFAGLFYLKQKPMAPGEIKRFIDRFGLQQLLDKQAKSYEDAGLKYLKVTDAELLGRIERDPKLLLLPLVRSGKHVSIGQDEESWRTMLAG